jgi:hypothetical protein
MSYNPLTPSVLGNVEIKLADSTPLEIVHGKNTEIDIDFNYLIKGSESKSKGFKLGEFLGP